MPLFIGYISLTFPGGLVLYWVISNLFQIAQQWWMYRKPAETVGRLAKSMNVVEKSAKSIDEAVEQALNELGLNRNRLM